MQTIMHSIWECPSEDTKKALDRLNSQLRLFGYSLITLVSCCAKPDAVITPATQYFPQPSIVQSSLPLALPNSSIRRPVIAPSVVYGTGRFVGYPKVPLIASQLEGEPVTLDFSNADVRDVVRSVMGDLLKLPYAVDPAAQGTITLQSGGPIARSQVISELSSSLRLIGLAVVQSNGLYKVVSLAQAAREVQISGATDSGYIARIVTPHYVAAAELEKLLEPLVPNGTNLRAEPARNVLIVTGPAQDVTSLLTNLAIFDVDTIRGMSTALLPLKAAGAAEVAKEISGLLASSGDATAVVHVVPLERLNALLVTSMNPDYISRIRRWVDSLDKGGSSSERQLFVYDVQNGRAAELAEVLRKALGISGETSVSSSQGEQSNDQGGMISSSSTAAAAATQNPLLGGLASPGIVPSGSGNASSQSRETENSGADLSKTIIGITADQTNNALLIRATSEEYASIAAALRRLDIPQLQVMVETTVAEVTLTNQLSYGLQYYVKSGNLQALFAAPAAGSTSTSFSGFNFASGLNVAYGTAAGSTAILQLLQQLTNVRVLSSPNLFVANNQSARIEVGDQVPIATGSATSTISSNAPIVNSIEYRDTGIILKITPRVNASGIVSLDVSEEVSSVSSTTTSSLNSPTISERSLNTTVSVGNGQTVALGGLISDNRTTSKNGVPVLQDIPGLGWLFGQRNNQLTRTELIAILTPHVVRTPNDMQAITDELQRKLPLTFPVTHTRP